MSFTVQVLNENDDPVKHAKVMLSFKDYTNSIEYTDSDGYAYFDSHKNNREMTVYVNGNDYDEYTYEDGESITITI